MAVRNHITKADHRTLTDQSDPESLGTWCTHDDAHIMRSGYGTADAAGLWADAHADEAPHGRHIGVYEGTEPGTFDVMCIPDER